MGCRAGAEDSPGPGAVPFDVAPRTLRLVGAQNSCVSRDHLARSTLLRRPNAPVQLRAAGARCRRRTADSAAALPRPGVLVDGDATLGGSAPTARTPAHSQ